jgi:hypothetical protein
MGSGDMLQKSHPDRVNMRKQVQNFRLKGSPKNLWRRLEKTGSIVAYLLFVSKFDFSRKLELLFFPSK